MLMNGDPKANHNQTILQHCTGDTSCIGPLNTSYLCHAMSYVVYIVVLLSQAVSTKSTESEQQNYYIHNDIDYYTPRCNLKDPHNIIINITNTQARYCIAH